MTTEFAGPPMPRLGPPSPTYMNRDSSSMGCCRSFTYAIIIGIIAIAAIVLIIVIINAVKVPSPTKSFYRSVSGYKTIISPKQRAVIQQLVYSITPRIQGQPFDKSSIERMIGVSPEFDQVMYFYFRKQLMNGTLSVGNMEEAVSGSMHV